MYHLDHLNNNNKNELDDSHNGKWSPEPGGSGERGYVVTIPYGD